MAKSNTCFKPKELHPNWNGGVIIDSYGYRLVLTGGHNRYQKEHIIVAEDILERKLKPNEVVHHINEIRDDNRPENLAVMTRSEHTYLHSIGRKFSEEQKQNFRLIRKGTNQKEDHPQWKQNITKEDIINALSLFNLKKDVALYLGIHIDTLRARIKYYKIGNKKED